MKILIPTAKELNLKLISDEQEKYENDISREIIVEFSNKSIQDLEKIYKIKKDKAEVEYQRWQELAEKTAKLYPAFELFNGLMYRNIDREQFSCEDKKYIEENIFITTALYGVINAYNLIALHRLDFLQKIKINNHSLTNLWREQFDSSVSNDEFIISLLSSEFEQVFSKNIRDRFVKITFMEEKEGELKIHSTISKKARGKFLTELIINKIDTREKIKDVTFDNFRYEKELSTENNLVFVAR